LQVRSQIDSSVSLLFLPMSKVDLSNVSSHLRGWMDNIKLSQSVQATSTPMKLDTSSQASTRVPSPSTSWDEEASVDAFGPPPGLMMAQQPPGLGLPPGLEVGTPATDLAAVNAQLRYEHEQLLLKAENLRLAQENALLRMQSMHAMKNMNMPMGVWQQNVCAQTAQPARSAQPARTQLKPVDPKTPTVPERARTTVMIRNLPTTFNRDDVVRTLNDCGFQGRFDFLYVPIDFRSDASLGYAFVNMTSPADARELWTSFDGFKDWGVPSDRTCSVCWSSPHQGYDDHVLRFRNSPVMHEDVPLDHKPMIFQNGGEVAFPEPTKKLRPPRLRPVVRAQPTSKSV